MKTTRAISTSSKMQIQTCVVSSLKPHPDNPRIHSQKQINQIAKSIETFGFKVPVLIDGQNQIIAGHGRVMACEKLGLEKVPTIKVTDLSKDEVRALMIADNKLTENAQWDDELLAQNFQVLSDLDLNFDLDVSGFEYGEIESLMISIESCDDYQKESDDEFPELPTEPVTRIGDLWLLGEHRIYCGDALQSASYKAVLGRKKASIVFTDPPYNLSAKNIGKVAERVHGNFHQAAGEMSEAEFEGFLAALFEQWVKFSKSGSIHYVCMDWRHLPEILSAGKSQYAELKNMCVWAKDRAGMGSFYRSQHEMVLVFKNGNGAHQNHFQLGEYGRYRSNVWSYPSVRSFKESDGDIHSEAALQCHPTIKPVALVKDALLDCSKRNEIVLDAFLGSGTTLLAAEQSQRHCVGIEISPMYVDVAIQRWEAMTGKEAVHSESQIKFSELKKERNNEEG